MKDKRLWLWALYDFANSLVLMAFLFYFSQWLVADRGMPAWWYNAALVASSALFILTAPFISKKIDAHASKISGLRFWTALTIVGYATVSLLVILTKGTELLATILYSLATYTYLTSFLYFTPMLNDLSSASDRSWKSGIGHCANSLGQVIGVLLALPFATGLTLFGEPGRGQALLPATVIFALLALPMLLLYREDKKAASESVPVPPSIMSLIRSVFGHKPLALLLLAYFLYSDAMLTFANNFPLYLETVHHATDTVKSVLTASILVLAAVGAAVFGKIADRKGALKTLKVILVIWCFIFLAMGLITDFKLLVPLFLFAGILFGPVYALSRALVGHLAPTHLVASSYSFYVVAERFATFVGPALWSVILVTGGEGTQGYQAALLSLSALIVVSLFVLNRIKVSNQYV